MTSTLIIGAKCIDGIVIGSDRKIHVVGKPLMPIKSLNLMLVEKLYLLLKV